MNDEGPKVYRLRTAVRVAPFFLCAFMLAVSAADPPQSVAGSQVNWKFLFIFNGFVFACSAPALWWAFRHRLTLDECHGTLQIRGTIRTRTVQLSDIARIRFRRFDKNWLVLTDQHGRKLGMYSVYLTDGSQLTQRLDTIAKNRFGASAGFIGRRARPGTQWP